MKVKVISRDPEQYTRSCKTDMFRVQRNYDPTLHPFEKAREYTRALNAAKLDRLFAKPFIASLEGHIDGVYTLAKHPKELQSIASGSADGELRLWSLSERKCKWNVKAAHKGFVRGICFAPVTGQNGKLISCGDDHTIKIWDTMAQQEEPELVLHGNSFYNAVDHHYKRSVFASCGSKVDIWDQYRNEPLQSFSWGADTINAVKFSPTEVDVFASAGTDRNVILYDLRYQSPITKAVMRLKANAICWNPIEAFNFSVASEDSCCYTFDMRNMSKALNIFKDHVSAVLDIDYSPTGQEIVTGSFDKTIRIFNVFQGHSREIYHTKRMQHAFNVKYSMDSKYLLSGSDDGNIRIWKSNASESMAPKSNREAASLQYQESLKQRYSHMPEVARIRKSKPVPKSIKLAQKKQRIQLDSIKRKEENRRQHQADGTVPRVPEREQTIIQIEK